MQTKTIDIDAAVKTGWRIVTKNWMFFVGLSLFLFLSSFGQNFIEGLTMKPAGSASVPTITTMILYIVFFFFNLLIGIGFIKISLESVKNKELKFSDLFSGINLMGKYFVAGLLVGLIAGIPLLPWVAFIATFLFPANSTLIIIRIILAVLGLAGVIVSVYFSLKFTFFKYFIVDKNSNIIESLKLSSETTKGVKWQLILFGLVMAGIMLLGFIALLVGILIALPVAMVASAAVYQQLAGQTLTAPVKNPEAK
jgi:hypothetical protein